jgi:hypothetical protein|mmetsp:Transcript_5442/g.9854  ORF Transcript_5442/g.9854 Transcript_5442/m.9854 type:complete len:460 (+) Transcript_5442:54-1433(+)
MFAAIQQLQGEKNGLEKALEKRIHTLGDKIQALKDHVQKKQELEERIRKLKEDLQVERIKAASIRGEKGVKANKSYKLEAATNAFNNQQDSLRIEVLSKRLKIMKDADLDHLTADDKVLKVHNAEADNKMLKHQLGLCAKDNKLLLSRNEELLDENSNLKRQLELLVGLQEELVTKSKIQKHGIYGMLGKYESLSLQTSGPLNMDPKDAASRYSSLHTTIKKQQRMISALKAECVFLKGVNAAMNADAQLMDQTFGERREAEYEMKAFLLQCIEDVKMATTTDKQPLVDGGVPINSEFDNQPPMLSIPPSKRREVIQTLQNYCGLVTLGDDHNPAFSGTSTSPVYTKRYKSPLKDSPHRVRPPAVSPSKQKRDPSILSPRSPGSSSTKWVWSTKKGVAPRARLRASPRPPPSSERPRISSPAANTNRTMLTQEKDEESSPVGMFACMHAEVFSSGPMMH